MLSLVVSWVSLFSDYHHSMLPFLLLQEAAEVAVIVHEVKLGCPVVKGWLSFQRLVLQGGRDVAPLVGCVPALQAGSEAEHVPGCVHAKSEVKQEVVNLVDDEQRLILTRNGRSSCDRLRRGRVVDEALNGKFGVAVRNLFNHRHIIQPLFFVHVNDSNIVHFLEKAEQFDRHSGDPAFAKPSRENQHSLDRSFSGASVAAGGESPEGKLVIVRLVAGLFEEGPDGG